MQQWCAKLIFPHYSPWLFDDLVSLNPGLTPVFLVLKVRNTSSMHICRDYFWAILNFDDLTFELSILDCMCFYWMQHPFSLKCMSVSLHRNAVSSVICVIIKTSDCGLNDKLIFFRWIWLSNNSPLEPSTTFFYSIRSNLMNMLSAHLLSAGGFLFGRTWDVLLAMASPGHCLLSSNSNAGRRSEDEIF